MAKGIYLKEEVGFNPIPTAKKTTKTNKQKDTKKKSK